MFMATRRQIRPPAPHRATSPPSSRRNYAAIEAARNRLFAELTKLRSEHGPAARAAETAQVLLTRSWARASWSAREKLIGAAEWLLRLQRNRAVEPFA